MKELDWKEFFENNSNWDWELDNTHYVSKFILKQFVPEGDKSGKIVVYDKEEERFTLLPPKKAASQEGFYTVGVEKELAKLEDKAAKILQRKLFKSIDLSQAEEEILRLFTLQMMGRGPGMRRQLQTSDSIAKGELAELRRELALQGIIKESSWWEDKIERGMAAGTLWSSRPEGSPSRALIQKMERRVFILPDQFPLVIGDNPCMFIHRGKGLKEPDCELALVLSPSHLLHFSWKSGGGYTSLENVEEGIQSLDANTVGKATKFLYANSKHAIERALKNYKTLRFRLDYGKVD